MPAANEFTPVERLTRRAFAHMVAMIHVANERPDAERTDPKVAATPPRARAASTSSAPCTSSCGSPATSSAASRTVRPPTRAAPRARRVPSPRWPLVRRGRGGGGDAPAAQLQRDGAPVFQSYHARATPTRSASCRRASVGIPPVAAVYLALAHRYARQHGWQVEEPHFWCMMGDSEFREGSLLEALPEVAERELGNVTWIIDYNRQNLDGTRIPNNRGLKGTDADRIERTAIANGWEVIQLRHGSFREQVFARAGGPRLRAVFEERLSDYHFRRCCGRTTPRRCARRCSPPTPRARPRSTRSALPTSCACSTTSAATTSRGSSPRSSRAAATSARRPS